MNPLYFDTHTHLHDDRYGTDVDTVIDRALASGVSRMVVCGTDESDWQAVLALAHRNPCVIPLLGLHPWFVEDAKKDWLRTLEHTVREWPVGIGECGLDFALESFDRERQEEVFQSQLHLARDMNRPVSIHCRRAWERHPQAWDARTDRTLTAVKPANFSGLFAEFRGVLDRTLPFGSESGEQQG